MTTKNVNKWITGLLLAGALCTMLGCSLFQKAAATVSALEEAKVADKYEPSEQYYIGRGVSSVILNEYKPAEIKDAKTEGQIKYLNDMAGYIERASKDVTRSALKLGDHTDRGHDAQQQVYDLVLFKGIQVGLLETEEVTAFATPGGFAWVSYGAIRMCNNEDELAAIVAHEMSHIILDHGMANYRRAHKNQIITSALSETWFSGSGVGAQFGHMCVTFAQDAFNGFNPGQELEADNWATRALVASGYSPEAMIAVLKQVAAYEKTNKVDPESYLAHHPSIDERIKAVQDLIKTENFKANPKTQTADKVAARAKRFTEAFGK